MWDAGLVAGRVRRIERQFGQESLARRIAGGDLLELQQIGLRGCGVLVAGVRDAARTSAAHAPNPPARRRALQAAGRVVDEARPVFAGARRRRRSASARDRVGGFAMRSSIVCAVVGPTPGRSCSTRKPATRSRGFSAKRSSASTSLTCAASRNFKPPNFTKGMLRRVSSIFERAAVMRGAEQHRLVLQRRAGLAVLQHASRRCSAPVRLRRAR